MVGIPSFKNAATIGYVVRAAQAGLVQYFPDLRPVLVNADAGSPDGTQRVVVETEPPDYVERILLVRPTQQAAAHQPDLSRGRRRRRQGRRAAHDLPDRGRAEGARRWSSSTRTCARSCRSGSSCSPAPSRKAASTSWRRSTRATSTTARSPTPSPTRMTRALYGLRIRQPIGGDFGVCGDLVRHYLEQDDWDADVSQVRHRHLDDDQGDHRRLRGLPDPTRRQGARPQGSGSRPRTDVQRRSSARSCA